MKRPSLLTLTITFTLGFAVAAPAQFVWIEGEDAVKHSMKRHDWYDSVNRDSLSGNAWLSHFADGHPPEAFYSFRIAGQDGYLSTRDGAFYLASDQNT